MSSRLLLGAVSTASQYPRHLSGKPIVEPLEEVETSTQGTSLDPRNKNVELHTVGSYEKSYLFKNHTTLKGQIDAYFAGHPSQISKSNRWKKCGTNAWIQKSPTTGRVRVVAESCRLRICPRCQRQRRHKLFTQCVGFLSEKTEEKHRFITLTMRSNNAPLHVQLSNLRSAFRRLRQRKLWKDNVSKGIAIIEVTYNTVLNQWHPHVHVLARGGYIDQRKLSQSWGICTKGSTIVDIRMIRNVAKAAEYISSYVAKPPAEAVSNTSELLAEWIETMQSQRMQITFGGAVAAAAVEDKSDDPGDWVTVGSLNKILQDAANGEESAIQLLKTLEGVKNRVRHSTHTDST
jgi:hypothetical protein